MEDSATDRGLSTNGTPEEKMALDRHLLSRRQFLGVGTGGVIAASALLYGCGGHKTANGGGAGSDVVIPDANSVPGPGPVSGGRYGGRAVVSFSDAPDSNDPAVGSTLSAYDVTTGLVFSGSLLAYGGQHGGPVANLANMPTTSADGRELVFVLRDRAKFQNGRAITAEDVKWSWERMLAPATGSWGSSYVSSIVGVDAVLAGKTKSLDGVEVVDDRTLKVHLTQPDFTILNAMCLPVTAPVPQEEVARLGRQFAKTPVGYGPFRIVSYSEASQRAVFARNEDYLWKGLPYVDEVEMHWGMDAQARMMQVEHGNVDFLGDGVPPSLVSSTLSNPALKEQIQVINQPGLRYVTLYRLTEPPFSNRLVRQALNWAVDRDSLARMLHGESEPLAQPFPRGFPGYVSTFKPYGYDPTKAKQLLAEAGYPSGFSTTLSFANTDPQPAIAQVVQQQFAEIGVRLELNQLNAPALFSTEPKDTLDMSLDQSILVQPSPADLVDSFFTKGAGVNHNRYFNPRLDRLAAEAHTKYTLGDQNAIYAEIEQILGDDAPWVWLLSHNFVAIHTRRLQNYHYRSELGNYYDRLWLTS